MLVKEAKGVRIHTDTVITKFGSENGTKIKCLNSDTGISLARQTVRWIVYGNKMCAFMTHGITRTIGCIVYIAWVFTFLYV